MIFPFHMLRKSWKNKDFPSEVVPSSGCLCPHMRGIPGNEFPGGEVLIKNTFRNVKPLDFSRQQLLHLRRKIQLLRKILQEFLPSSSPPSCTWLMKISVKLPVVLWKVLQAFEEWEFHCWEELSFHVAHVGNMWNPQHTPLPPLHVFTTTLGHSQCNSLPQNSLTAFPAVHFHLPVKARSCSK